MISLFFISGSLCFLILPYFPPATPLHLITASMFSMSVNLILFCYIHLFYFGFYKSVKTNSIYFLSDLFHKHNTLLVLSLLQIAKFHSFLGGRCNTAFVCVCVCVCTHKYIHTTSSLFIHLLMNT